MFRSLALATLTLVGAATTTQAEEGAFDISVGGRVHVEASTSSPDPALEERFQFEDGVDWRRARLVLNGEFLDRFTFKIEHDFASGDVVPTDVFIEATPNDDAATFRAGHFKEPFSLSIQQSSNSHSFIARPAAVTALAPGRNLGFMVHDRLPGDRVAWAVGAFRDSDGYDMRPGSDLSLSGRLTGLALNGDEGSDPLLHLGVALSQRQPTADTVRLRGRTGVRLAPRTVNTGRLPADGLRLAGAEFLLARSSFWLQGEVLSAQVDLLTDGRRARFEAQYVEAGWFLTGERKPYSRSSRSFTRLRPKAPMPDGRGAWELAARWDHIDLSRGSVLGGSQQSLSVALNWYLRSNLRFLGNYVSTDPAGAGSVEHVGLFLHFDF
ncbi:MAG: porin [Acidobacteriota bacterium]|nr:porin [Acidobacteriota bacterium]MDE3264562.1 porin [Acidobacteriota bacterium]